MRVLVLLIFLQTFLLVSCGGKTTERAKNGHDIVVEKGDTESVPVPVFERVQYDFGNLVSGEKVTYSFRFVNEGTSPLIVYGVRSGCGCTVGDYPKEPVLPNQSARIKVDFNSTGRRGKQIQTVQVLTNADPSEYQLVVTADVEMK